jgi:hypothetical protein
MRTHDTQGSFIALISTPTAAVEETGTAESVSIHPRADFVAALLLEAVVFRSMQRRLAEEARLTPKVYRFSSIDDDTPAHGSGNSSAFCQRRAR